MRHLRKMKRILAVFMTALLFLQIPSVTRAEAVAASDPIASGTSNNVAWVIDADGKLTVTGIGDLDRAGKTGADAIPWCPYRTQITSAKVDVTGMTDGSYLFYGCYNMEDLDISGLETKHMTNMSHMFDMYRQYGDLTSWSRLKSLDVSQFETENVTDMSYMFSDCGALKNLDVSRFKTDNVTNMSYMFYRCYGLESLDVSQFKTENVTDMSYMFFWNTLKSLNVSNFNTENVTDMRYMFYDCAALESLDLSSFNAVNANQMSDMLSGCRNLVTLKTPSNVTKSVGLPEVTGRKWYLSDGTPIYALPLNLSESVELTHVEEIASGVNGDIIWQIDKDGKLTVRGSGDLDRIRKPETKAIPWYSYAGKITSAEINVTGMTDGSYLFYGCGNMESIDLSGLETEYMTNMSYMFSGCRGLESLDLSSFDAANAVQMGGMLDYCDNLVTLKTPRNVKITVSLPTKWQKPDGTTISQLPQDEAESIELTRVEEIDSGTSGNIVWQIDKNGKLTVTGTGDLDRTDKSERYAIPWYPYAGQITSAEVDVTGMTDGSYLFYGCSNMESLDLDRLETENMTNMSYMFSGVGNNTSLKTLDVSKFNTAKVTDMSGMFSGCSKLESLDLSGFDTGNVTNMYNMFYNCYALENLNVSNFNTANVTNMDDMFYRCYALKSLDVSSFDTGNVTNMDNMFHDCAALESLDVSNFNTENVTDMASMFNGCYTLESLDLSNFNMENVAYAGSMFSRCNSLVMLSTPYNVKISVELPVMTKMIWSLPDGTPVTELPQDLTESITLTHEELIPPKIITTDEDLNGSEVIRVKYVPYSVTVETDNRYEWNGVTFSIAEGSLPRGLEIDPGSGELYGVPLEEGSFTVTVKAEYSSPEFEDSYAKLTVIVLEDSDEAVSTATDAGYELRESVPALDLANMSESGGQTLVSIGEYKYFTDVYLDGIKLQKEADYTSEEGSTRITIRNQTLSRAGSGNHTLGVEFHEEDNKNTLKRASQKIKIEDTRSEGGDDQKPDDGNQGNQKPDDGNQDSQKPDDGNQGNQKPDDGNQNNQKPENGNQGSQQPDNGNSGNEDSDNSGSDSGSAGSSGDDTADGSDGGNSGTGTTTTIVYTVMPGDTLWKISAKIFGTGGLWSRIYKENAAVISNPDRISIGTKLTLTLTGSNSSATSASGTDGQTTGNSQKSVYKAAPGDTLWDIARKVYGRGWLWEIIYQANRNIIPSPRHLRAGQELVIPER